MLLEPNPAILNLNRKLLEEIEDYNPEKIIFNNFERTKDELIEIVGNFKISAWQFSSLNDGVCVLEMCADEDWWVPM